MGYNEERKKERFEPQTYKVHVTDVNDAWQAALDVLLGLDVPIINEILEPGLDIDGATRAMLNAYLENQPQLMTGTNFFWTISTTATKCTIKTDQFVTFGWNVRDYLRANRDYEANIKGVDLFVTLHRPDNTIADMLSMNGFELLPPRNYNR